MPMHAMGAASLEAQLGRDMQVAFILPCMTFYKRCCPDICAASMHQPLACADLYMC